MTREEVVEILKELWRYEKTTKYNDAQIRKALETAVEALEEEPRKTAKWLPYEYGDGTWHKCSNCGKPTRYLHSYKDFYGKEHLMQTQIQNYCRYCGAKMEEEE